MSLQEAGQKSKTCVPDQYKYSQLFKNNENLRINKITQIYLNGYLSDIQLQFDLYENSCKEEEENKEEQKQQVEIFDFELSRSEFITQIYYKHDKKGFNYLCFHTEYTSYCKTKINLDNNQEKRYQCLCFQSDQKQIQQLIPNHQQSKIFLQYLGYYVEPQTKLILKLNFYCGKIQQQQGLTTYYSQDRFDSQKFDNKIQNQQQQLQIMQNLNFQVSDVNKALNKVTQIRNSLPLIQNIKNPKNATKMENLIKAINKYDELDFAFDKLKNKLNLHLNEIKNNFISIQGIIINKQLDQNQKMNKESFQIELDQISEDIKSLKDVSLKLLLTFENNIEDSSKTIKAAIQDLQREIIMKDDEENKDQKDDLLTRKKQVQEQIDQIQKQITENKSNLIVNFSERLHLNQLIQNKQSQKEEFTKQLKELNQDYSKAKSSSQGNNKELIQSQLNIFIRSQETISKSLESQFQKQCNWQNNLKDQVIKLEQDCADGGKGFQRLYLFVLDQSGSMYSEWAKVIDQVIEFTRILKNISRDSQYNIIKFDDSAELVYPTKKQIIDEPKSNISCRGGGTDFDPAFQKCQEFFDQQKDAEEIPIIFFMTDGSGNYSNSQAILKNMSRQYQNSHFQAFFIGFGEYCDQNILQILSKAANNEESEKFLFNVENSKNLLSVFKDMQSESEKKLKKLKTLIQQNDEQINLLSSQIEKSIEEQQKQSTQLQIKLQKEQSNRQFQEDEIYKENISQIQNLIKNFEQEQQILNSRLAECEQQISKGKGFFVQTQQQQQSITQQSEPLNQNTINSNITQLNIDEYKDITSLQNPLNQQINQCDAQQKVNKFISQINTVEEQISQREQLIFQKQEQYLEWGFLNQNQYSTFKQQMLDLDQMYRVFTQYITRHSILVKQLSSNLQRVQKFINNPEHMMSQYKEFQIIMIKYNESIDDSEEKLKLDFARPQNLFQQFCTQIIEKEKNVQKFKECCLGYLDYFYFQSIFDIRSQLQSQKNLTQLCFSEADKIIDESISFDFEFNDLQKEFDDLENQLAEKQSQKRKIESQLKKDEINNQDDLQVQLKDIIQEITTIGKSKTKSENSIQNFKNKFKNSRNFISQGVKAIYDVINALYEKAIQYVVQQTSVQNSYIMKYVLYKQIEPYAQQIQFLKQDDDQSKQKLLELENQIQQQNKN